MKVKSESEVTQSCPTLSDPMDCSPPGSSIHGIFQARVLKWGAIVFSDSKSTQSYIYLRDFFGSLSNLACKTKIEIAKASIGTLYNIILLVVTELHS